MGGGDEDDRRGVYKIDYNCGKSCIDVTEWALSHRKYEHQYATNGPNYHMSVLVYHAVNKITWDTARIVGNPNIRRK